MPGHPRVRAALERLQWFKDTPAALWAIVAVNAVGIAYGFYYYVEQFQVTPPWLWVVVPDSPLAVLWAQAALLLYALGRRRRSDHLDALAFVGNVQVGLWSAFVLLAYPEMGFSFTVVNLNWFLFWGHLGMVLLALLFVRDLSISLAARPSRKWHVLAVPAAYYLIQNVMDYFLFTDLYGTGCGLRPITVPCVPGMEIVLTAVTFTLTLGALGALAWLTRAAAPDVLADATAQRDASPVPPMPRRRHDP